MKKQRKHNKTTIKNLRSLIEWRFFIVFLFTILPVAVG